MISLHNCSSQNVIITINGENKGTIEAGESTTYNWNQADNIIISMRHINESYIKLKKVYMKIETTCEIDLSNITNLYISREKMMIDSDAYYDYFILKVDEHIITPIQYRVLGEERLKNDLVHSGILWMFFDALENLVMELLLSPFASLIIGGIILWVFGWKWLLITLVCLYIFSFIGRCMDGRRDKFLVKLFGEKFKQESITERFERWTDSEYIAAFYTNPNKKPYMGKIEM